MPEMLFQRRPPERTGLPAGTVPPGGGDHWLGTEARRQMDVGLAPAIVVVALVLVECRMPAVTVATILDGLPAHRTVQSLSGSDGNVEIDARIETSLVQSPPVRLVVVVQHPQVHRCVGNLRGAGNPQGREPRRDGVAGQRSRRTSDIAKDQSRVSMVTIKADDLVGRLVVGPPPCQPIARPGGRDAHFRPRQVWPKARGAVAG